MPFKGKCKYNCEKKGANYAKSKASVCAILLINGKIVWRSDAEYLCSHHPYPFYCQDEMRINARSYILCKLLLYVLVLWLYDSVGFGGAYVFSLVNQIEAPSFSRHSCCVLRFKEKC